MLEEVVAIISPPNVFRIPSQSIVEGGQPAGKKGKYHTLYSHADVHRLISTKFCTIIEVVRTIISPPNFLGPINSLATRGRRKFG